MRHPEMQGRVLSQQQGRVLSRQQGCWCVTHTGAGGEQVVMGRLGSAGPLQSPTPASQSGAGRQGGHTDHTCCGHVYVSVSTRESRVS